MSKRAFLLFLTSLLLIVLVFSGSTVAQDGRGMSKSEYYQKIAEARGWENELTKPSGFADRKYGMFDKGKIRLQINNANRLGYSREMITFEYPIGSGLTYQWCQALMVGGKLNGEKRISNGAIGCYEDINENHYEPLPGYDSGIGDNGLAMSNKPNSWPSFTGGAWPADAGTVGSIGFPGVYDDGEVAADAEGVWMAVDDDPDCKQLTPLHLRTFGRAMQWSSILADDFIVFKYTITNSGTDIIEDMYAGIHTDMDSPEEGSGEWMDDFGKFISAEEDPILGNFLYLWDGDDKSAGFIEKNVAWQGLKMLETPLGEDGEELGLTTLVVETYDDFITLPDQASVYDFLARGIDPIDNIDPHPTDWTQTPNTYGPDITSLHASGPFDLGPGETITFTFANVFGVNKADMLANATLCQLLYDKNYKTSVPPLAPAVTAVAGDQEVTLYWDANPSESSVDPLTGNNAFQGYRIYRSDDRGLTWGDAIYDAIGALAGYLPIAQCDIVDGIVGTVAANPFLHLGDDSGLFHKFTDQNLKNGVEYWYAVCAYDGPDVQGDLIIPPMENAKETDPTLPGDNTVSVIPQATVPGYSDPSVLTDIQHTVGVSTATVSVAIVDPNAVVSGNYEIGFLIDDDGTKVFVDRGDTMVLFPTLVTAPDDPNVGQIPAFEGLRLTAIDEAAGVSEFTGSAADWTYLYGYWELPPQINHDYEVEFTADLWDIYPFWRFYGYSDPIAQVPFKITNITEGYQLYPTFRDAGDYNLEYDEWERIILSHTPYGTGEEPASYDGYIIRFWGAADNAQPGDKVVVHTAKPFTLEDRYTFSTEAATVAATKDDLDDINVVPNPYAITSSYEYSQTPWVKELQFHHLPAECTISIFTVSGELVKILNHNSASDGYRGPSVEAWNLWNYNDQEVAFGVYIYHVKAEGIGEKVGKFAVIK